MTMPRYSRSANIRLTFQQVVGETLTVNTVGPTGDPLVLTVPVFHNYRWADPENSGDPQTTPVRAWISITWLGGMAGRGGWSVAQVDCYSRIGAQTDSERDPFGVIVDDIADEFETLFRGMDPTSGIMRGMIPIQDFADPLNPVDAGACLFVQKPGGPPGDGQPTERRALWPNNGFNRVMVRYHLRIERDSPALMPAMEA